MSDTDDVAFDPDVLASMSVTELSDSSASSDVDSVQAATPPQSHARTTPYVVRKTFIEVNDDDASQQDIDHFQRSPRSWNRSSHTRCLSEPSRISDHVVSSTGSTSHDKDEGWSVNHPSGSSISNASVQLYRSPLSFTTLAAQDEDFHDVSDASHDHFRRWMHEYEDTSGCCTSALLPPSDADSQWQWWGSQAVEYGYFPESWHSYNAFPNYHPNSVFHTHDPNVETQAPWVGRFMASLSMPHTNGDLVLPTTDYQDGGISERLCAKFAAGAEVDACTFTPSLAADSTSNPHLWSQPPPATKLCARPAQQGVQQQTNSWSPASFHKCSHQRRGLLRENNAGPSTLTTSQPGPLSRCQGAAGMASDDDTSTTTASGTSLGPTAAKAAARVHCQVVWCDPRAFKSEVSVMRHQLEVAAGAAVKAHKSADKCIRLLRKKQHTAGRAPCVFLVSWANAPALLPYLSQVPHMAVEVVLLADVCRSRRLDAAEKLACLYPFITRIAMSWPEALEAVAETVRQKRAI